MLLTCERLLTCSPPRVLPTDQVSDGETPPAELAESRTASHPSPPGATKDAMEVSSQQAPLEPNTGGGGDDVMVEANTSAAKDPGRSPSRILRRPDEEMSSHLQGCLRSAPCLRRRRFNPRLEIGSTDPHRCHRPMGGRLWGRLYQAPPSSVSTAPLWVRYCRAFSP